jgi:hypothetical protein
LFTQGQNSYVDVRMDTTVIRIGEQASLHLVVSYPANASLQWPAVTDTLNKHLEVVKDSGADTTQATNGLMRQVRTLAITSFDSGFWAVPPFRFVINGTAMETEALLLEVRTVQLDSAMALRSIHDIQVLPFSLAYWIREHAPWVAGGALAVAVLVTILVLLLRKKKPQEKSAVPETVLPLHERILAALGQLDQQRVWQQGDHKSYHSRLTDLLRSYIEERFRVPAMESTTDELLLELRVSPLNSDQRGQLENMLRLADMVKFAKALPSAQENEQMMSGAQRFVKDTAPKPSTPDHA